MRESMLIFCGYLSVQNMAGLKLQMDVTWSKHIDQYHKCKEKFMISPFSNGRRHWITSLAIPHGLIGLVLPLCVELSSCAWASTSTSNALLWLVIQRWFYCAILTKASIYSAGDLSCWSPKVLQSIEKPVTTEAEVVLHLKTNLGNWKISYHLGPKQALKRDSSLKFSTPESVRPEPDPPGRVTPKATFSVRSLLEAAWQ